MIGLGEKSNPYEISFILHNKESLTAEHQNVDLKLRQRRYKHVCNSIMQKIINNSVVEV